MEAASFPKMSTSRTWSLEQAVPSSSAEEAPERWACPSAAAEGAAVSLGSLGSDDDAPTVFNGGRASLASVRQQEAASVHVHASLVQARPSVSMQREEVEGAEPEAAAEPSMSLLDSFKRPRKQRQQQDACASPSGTAATAVRGPRAPRRQASAEPMASDDAAGATDAANAEVDDDDEYELGRGRGGHKMVEKQRRDRLNALIEELGDIVPPFNPKYKCANRPRRAKHVILGDVLTLLKLLKENAGAICAATQAQAQLGAPAAASAAAVPEDACDVSPPSAKRRRATMEAEAAAAPAPAPAAAAPPPAVAIAGVVVEQVVPPASPSPASPAPMLRVRVVRNRAHRQLVVSVVESLRALGVAIASATVFEGPEDWQVQDVYELPLNECSPHPEDVLAAVASAMRSCSAAPTAAAPGSVAAALAQPRQQPGQQAHQQHQVVPSVAKRPSVQQAQQGARLPHVTSDLSCQTAPEAAAPAAQQPIAAGAMFRPFSPSLTDEDSALASLLLGGGMDPIMDTFADFGAGQDPAFAAAVWA